MEENLGFALEKERDFAKCGILEEMKKRIKM